MNFRGIRILLMATFIGAVIPALVWVSFSSDDVLSDEESVPTSSEKADIKLPDFKITALQLGDKTRQIISCESQKCEALPAQQSDDTPAVTDGVSWYHYVIVEDRNGVKRLQLRRSWIDSEQSDLIIEETELVEPRGLFISPDNMKVAFWLDNTSRDSTGLTELWIYDSVDGGTKLVAENIKEKGVLTEPRWNRTSSHLFFLGETIVENKKQSAVHVVSIQLSGLSIPFSGIDWKEREEIVASGAMDISRSGAALAYVEPQFGRDILHIERGLGFSQQAKIFGQVPYLQWLTEENLLYVVQGRHTFTFWKLSNGTHKHIAKYQGEFQSARAGAQGKYLVFNVKYSNNSQRALLLDIESGQIQLQGSLPETDGRTYLIHFEAKEREKVVSVIDQIDDELIAGFVDKHLVEIAQDDVEPQRLIITDQPNTVFIDYIAKDNTRWRLLLAIQDATYVEWSIIARYTEQSSEWVRMQGGGVFEPKALRLYEWEEELNQWVLKDDYKN